MTANLLILFMMLLVTISPKANGHGPDRIHHYKVRGDLEYLKPILTNSESPDVLTINHNDHGRVKRGVLDGKDGLWPNATVLYAFVNPMPSVQHQKAFKSSVKHWTDSTCLKFIESSDKNTWRIHVKLWNKNKLSQATLGFVGSGCQTDCQFSSQSMDLANIHQNVKGRMVIHEMGHSLGLIHEQSRNNRDKYITLNKENMQQNLLSQFDIEKGTPNPFPLDLGSVMMYSANNMARQSGLVTMQTKDPNYLSTMGSGTIVSFIDALRINTAYECLCAESSIPTCSRGGYANVKDCSICTCPMGFGGATCDDVEPTKDGGYLMADGEWAQIKVTTKQQGIKAPYRAVYQIRAPKGQKVELLLVATNRGFRTGGIATCTNDYIEFKLGKEDEWRTTGYRFCDMAHSQYLHSQGSDAIVIANVERTFVNLIVHYRAVNLNAKLPSYLIPKILPAGKAIAGDDKINITAYAGSRFVRLKSECCGYFAAFALKSDGSALFDMSCDSNICPNTKEYVDLPEKKVMKTLPEKRSYKNIADIISDIFRFTQF